MSKLEDLNERLSSKENQVQLLNSEKASLIRQLEEDTCIKSELTHKLNIAVQDRSNLTKKFDIVQKVNAKSVRDGSIVRLQLEQVQADLNHYYKLSKHQNDLLEDYANLLQKLAVLISFCLNGTIEQGISGIKVVSPSIVHQLLERSHSLDAS